MDIEEGEILISSDEDISLVSCNLGARLDESHDRPRTKKSKLNNFVRNVVPPSKTSNVHWCSHKNICRRAFTESECLVKTFGGKRNDSKQKSGMKRRSLSRPMSTLHKTYTGFESSTDGLKKKKRKKESKFLRLESCSTKSKKKSKQSSRDSTALLQKVISHSGPHSVPSLLSAQLRGNASLMQKLITAGLAKNNLPATSTVGTQSDLTEPSVKKEESAVSVVTNEDDSNDSEIEVIIPPKKIPLLVTLDSDGDELDSHEKDDTLQEAISVQTETLVISQEENSKSTKLNENADSQDKNVSDVVSNDNISVSSVLLSDDLSVKCLDSEEEVPHYSPSSPSTLSSVESLNQDSEPLQLEVTYSPTRIIDFDKVLENNLTSNDQGTDSIPQCTLEEMNHITKKRNCSGKDSQTTSIFDHDYLSFKNESVFNSKINQDKSDTIEDSCMFLHSYQEMSKDCAFVSSSENISQNNSPKINEDLSTVYSRTVPNKNCPTESKPTENADVSSINNPVCNSILVEQTPVNCGINSTSPNRIINDKKNYMSADEEEPYSPSSDFDNVKSKVDEKVLDNPTLISSSVMTNFQMSETPANAKELCSLSSNYGCNKTEENIQNDKKMFLSPEPSVTVINSNQIEFLEQLVFETSSNVEDVSDFICKHPTKIEKATPLLASGAVQDLPSDDYLPCRDIEPDEEQVLCTRNTETCFETNTSEDEDDISQLRLIALSTKGKTNQSLDLNKKNSLVERDKEDSVETSSRSSFDLANEEEDVLQLRVAALKSAVIKKHELRKKRGLIKKRKRASNSIGNDTLMLSDLSNVNEEKENLSPLSPTPSTHSLKGEEDMEIADSDSGGDVILDMNSQETVLGVERTSPSVDPLNQVMIHCTNISNVTVGLYQNDSGLLVPPQPLPPGVDGDFPLSSSEVPKNISQLPIYSPVLPPPPPPPTTLMFNPLPPPPPPPLLPAIDPQQHFYQLNSHSNINHLQEQIPNFSSSGLSDEIPEKLCQSIDPVNILPSDNVTKTQPAETQSNDDERKVNHSCSNISLGEIKLLQNSNSKNEKVRPNLITIPVVKNVPKKPLTKNKLKRLRRRFRKDKIKQLTKMPEPNILCITNPSSSLRAKAKVNLVKNKSFPSFVKDTASHRKSYYSSRKENYSVPLCTTNTQKICDSTADYADGFLDQNTVCISSSQNLCNLEFSESGISNEKPSTFEDNEMDISEMIVLDEVGMSPEHKPRNELCWEQNPLMEEEDENTLRVRALSSLSSKTVPKKTASSNSTPSSFIHSETNQFYKNKDNFKATQSDLKIQSGSRRRVKDFKNVSVTRRNDINDCSKYKLTRCVRNEPKRSVIHGRESLKVVIPSDTSQSPPLLLPPQPSPPVVERFVIKVGQDSDSEEECEWTRRVRVQDNDVKVPPGPVVDLELERSIDLLLMNARQNVEKARYSNPSQVSSQFQKNNPMYSTPKSQPKFNEDKELFDTPLRLLPKAKQEEYQRLKKIIEEKEKQKNMQNKSLMPIKSIRKSQSPLQHVLISEANKWSQGAGKVTGQELSSRAKIDINISEPCDKHKERKEKSSSQKGFGYEKSHAENQKAALDTSSKPVFDQKKGNDSQIHKNSEGNKISEFKSNVEKFIDNRYKEFISLKKSNDKLKEKLSENDSLEENCLEANEHHSNSKASNRRDISERDNNIDMQENNKSISCNNLGDKSHLTEFNEKLEGVTIQNIPAMLDCGFFDQHSSATTKLENSVEDTKERSKENVKFSIEDWKEIASEEALKYPVKTSTSPETVTKHVSLSDEEWEMICLENAHIHGVSNSHRSLINEESRGELNEFSSIDDSKKVALEGKIKDEISKEQHTSIDSTKNQLDLNSKSCKVSDLNKDNGYENNISTSVNDPKKILSSKQEELLCERFVLIDNLSELSESLGELEREQDTLKKVAAEIKQLREALMKAEQSLHTQCALISDLEQRLSATHQNVCARDENIRLIEGSCQQLGGPGYKVPTTAKELSAKKFQQVTKKFDLVKQKGETLKSIVRNSESSKEKEKDLITNNTRLLQNLPKCSTIPSGNNLNSSQRSNSSSDCLRTSYYPLKMEESTINTYQITSLADQPELRQQSSHNTPQCAVFSQSSETNICERTIGVASSQDTASINYEPTKMVTYQEPSNPNKNKRLPENSSSKRPISEVSDVSCEDSSPKRILVECKRNNSSSVDSTNEQSSCDISGSVNSSSKSSDVINSNASIMKYKSILQYRNSTRTVKQSPDGPAFICPFDLSGKCQDKDCKFQHIQ